MTNSCQLAILFKEQRLAFMIEAGFQLLNPRKETETGDRSTFRKIFLNVSNL
jgi:hypothetical protein